jgi:hypothetical protein
MIEDLIVKQNALEKHLQSLDKVILSIFEKAKQTKIDHLS